jgi:hypothetical protein
MKNSIHYILSIVALLSLPSCEKVIDLDVKDDVGQLVVEALINDQPGVQTIFLSNNVPFTNTNTYPPVTGAQIEVNDDAGNSYAFKEGPAGTYTTDPMAGIYGRTYTLTVVTGNTTVNASSKMPVLVKLDSIGFRKNLLESDEDTRIISVHYQDPPGIANQYRFILYVNDSLVKRVFVNNDQLSDGRSVSFDLEFDDDDLSIHPGDKVAVEMQCIDKPIYTYWYSFSSQQSGNGPSGGVSPANPPTNITPRSLGYFSAHTSETRTITVR